MRARTRLKGNVRQRNFVARNPASKFDSLGKEPNHVVELGAVLKIANIPKSFNFPLTEADKKEVHRCIATAVSQGFGRETAMAIRDGFGKDMVTAILDGRGREMATVIREGFGPHIARAVKEGWMDSVGMAVRTGFGREMVIAFKNGFGRELADFIALEGKVSIAELRKRAKGVFFPVNWFRRKKLSPADLRSAVNAYVRQFRKKKK